MYAGKKIAVVMPAYNAAKTLQTAYDEVVAQQIVDTVIIVDDCSSDSTEEVAKALLSQSHPSTSSLIPKLIYHRHERNRGYGGNQKSCYELALKEGADIVVMVHPDCQYTPKLIPAIVCLIASGLHPCVMASRILGGYALKGGMPVWKYVANRALTFAMNILFGTKLSEFHSGYRAFSSDLLRRLPLGENTDDFAFDAEMLAEIAWTGATFGEVSCPTVYFDDASSINFRRSCTYGIGCLKVALLYRLCRWHLARSRKFLSELLVTVDFCATDLI